MNTKILEQVVDKTLKEIEKKLLQENVVEIINQELVNKIIEENLTKFIQDNKFRNVILETAAQDLGIDINKGEAIFESDDPPQDVSENELAKFVKKVSEILTEEIIGDILVSQIMENEEYAGKVLKEAFMIEEELE